MRYTGTREKNRKRLAKMANEAFVDHKLVPEQISTSLKMWYCGEKGTRMYSFRVIAGPGMLLVYGDVGNFMLQAHDHDLIPWIRGAIKSENYVIRKMVRKHKVFLDDEAELLLQRLVNDAEECDLTDDDEVGKVRDFTNRVRDRWDREYDEEHEFCKAFYEEGGEASYLESVMGHELSVYWTIECLKKFVELYNEHEAGNEEGLCSSFAALT
ncbi:hypothetical protein LCGC14_2016010 [marine sediment metagenome]|uniref:Uncharacterized protein n=1 Tax=marine sediment metagenome TaxID=412755 RepID=A0A0F9EZ01_9ZZZZ